MQEKAMLEFLAIIMVAVGGAITGTAVMVNTILGDQDRDEAGEIAERAEPPGLIARVRERILLRWDTTRRLSDRFENGGRGKD